MRMKHLLVVMAVVLVGGVIVRAQDAPRAPSAPTPPPAVAAPGEPMSFSFFLEGGNYLGIQPEDINRENMSGYGLSAPRGVGVSRVSEGSPAERAGLKKGDVLLQFDGEAVTSTRKLLRLLGEAAPEQTVRLTISRNGSEQQLTATLSKRENAARAYGMLAPEARAVIPRAPRAPQEWGNAPEVFTFGFGNSRRVGVSTTPLTKQLADHLGVSGGTGLLITSVAENSAASKAGLRAGDVITEVNGARVEDTGDFIRELNRKDDGEVTLTITRDKSQRTIKVTPERRQNPSFNMSDIQPVPMANFKLDLSDLRVLQAMPKFENFVLPKLDNLVLPKLENFVMPKLDKLVIPRLESLPNIQFYYE
jgi:serine protease Do